MSRTHKPLHMICSAPRAHLFTIRLAAQSGVTAIRSNSTKSGSSTDKFSFSGGAAPPRLPKEDQEIFEQLQRQSTGAFSTPRAPPKINQSPHASAADTAEAQSKIETRTEKLSSSSPQEHRDSFDKRIDAKGKGEELHPNIRRGAQPEFEGEVNPKTGEVGGPKNEPLRWGAAGEWSYNGRTTDF